MPLNYPNYGAGDVPSYQMSGVPFVTSSVANEVSTTPIRVVFPSVTRFITITNTDGSNGHDLRVGFTSKGVLGQGASISGSLHERQPDHRNYFVIDNGKTSPRLEVRCKEIYFLRDGSGGTDTSFTLVAGLTPIDSSNFPALTGSLGYLGIG
tara:strand:- start:2887 stop:3342 length:456 start_codon:yes stop_codon:yes gene_type:complete